MSGALLGLGIAATALLVLVVVGPRLLRALIRRRLHGYRVRVSSPDPARPSRWSGAGPAPRIAVIGGGLGGLAAASTLAERGLRVTVLESKAYIGGKIGAWPFTLSTGETISISHGFHAFFRHYYNLDAWLTRLGLRHRFAAIDDYLILDASGRQVSFREVGTTPVLNLLSLARHGVYRFSDVLFGPARDLMGVFLEYDARTTFARLDHYSLADFHRAAQLPPGLSLSFRTFARAFFAEDHLVSLAELVKSFHFYYLSHDRGLLYDHPVEDYEPALLAPIRAHLAAHGAELRLATPVHHLERTPDGGFSVDGERFDRVVLAADVVGTRAIMGSATGLPAAAARLERLAVGQRYAVLRVYVDRDVRPGLPMFVVTDRERLLDSVTLYHRFEAESAAYVARHGGAVLELHSYAVPDGVADDAVRGLLLEELVRFFPELRGLVVRDAAFQLRRDFTAFHAGLYADRPGTSSGVPGLYYAGDWVKLPFPAMLMEAAFSSGLLAANAILAELGVAGVAVDAVPSRGIMAGMPEPPARQRALPPR